MLNKSEFVYCRLALPFIALEKRKKDIWKLAGRRPAIKLFHCSSMLDKSRSAYGGLALPFISLDQPNFSSKVTWASPCNETMPLFSYARQIEICVMLSFAPLHRARQAKIDIFKFAGRHPAMTLSHCSAMLGKSKCVYCRLALPVNALDELQFVSKVSWASPCNGTIPLFSYARQSEVCVMPSCAFLHRARHAKIDICKSAGRHPVMRLAHYSALQQII